MGSGWVSQERWVDGVDLSRFVAGCCPGSELGGVGTLFPGVGESGRLCFASQQPVQGLRGWDSSCLFCQIPAPSLRCPRLPVPLTCLPSPCPGSRLCVRASRYQSTVLADLMAFLFLYTSVLGVSAVLGTQCGGKRQTGSLLRDK